MIGRLLCRLGRHLWKRPDWADERHCHRAGCNAHQAWHDCQWVDVALVVVRDGQRLTRQSAERLANVDGDTRRRLDEVLVTVPITGEFFEQLIAGGIPVARIEFVRAGNELSLVIHSRTENP